MSAPPSHPRRRGWDPPDIGAYFIRKGDGQVFQVKNVYRRDQQVQLAPDTGGRPIYAHATDLLRYYSPYEGWLER